MTLPLVLLFGLALDAVTDPLALSSPRSPKPIPRILPEKLYSTRQVGAGTWSPDGSRVVFPGNFSGRTNLWIVPSGGGWPVQLTVSDRQHLDPQWSPNGKWIAYTSDIDGNEVRDIFLVSPETGEMRNLTATPEDREEIPSWNPSGTRLAYPFRQKGSAHWRIRVVDVSTGTVVDVTEGLPEKTNYYDVCWSNDGRLLAFSSWNATFNSSALLVYDVATRKARTLLEQKPLEWYAAAGWSQDGELIVLSSALNRKANVATVDPSTSRVTWITRSEWDAGSVTVSRDGRKIAWTVNIDGRTETFVREGKSAQPKRLILPAGNNSPPDARAFSADGRRLLLVHSGATSPKTLVTHDLATGKTAQVTEPMPGGLRQEHMAGSTLVRYPSKDGRYQISAYVWVPYNLERNARTPAVVMVHGGPLAQIVDQFYVTAQYLVNLGYIVIAPNYRGSMGYGEDFLAANDRDFGGGDLEDVRSAADFLIRSGYVNPGKVALLGGSYGGYMTLMGLAKMPDFWAAGVALVPAVNWHTILAADPSNREYFLSKLGDPVENKSLWDDRSPIHHVDRIRVPLHLQAGGNDPRCPKSEAEAVVKALETRGGTVEYHLYENEGHGWARFENQVDSLRRIGEFLLRYVPPQRQ